MIIRRALSAPLALQATLIKVSANLVVQLLNGRRSLEQSSLDWQQVVEFAFYGLIGSQVGNIVQFALEDWFPSGNAGTMKMSPKVGTGGNEVRLGEKKDDDAVPKEHRRRWLTLGHQKHWRNVVAKLVLDQTFGLAISGCVFLVCTNIARVPQFSTVLVVIQQRLWPLIRAGWHIWPLVAICNFLWVPVRWRVLVAVCIGFGWSIFLSIFINRK